MQPIERLRGDVIASAAALDGNPVAIGNHFTNIIEGIRSILGSYEQVTLGYSQVGWHELSSLPRSVIFVHKSELK